VARNMRYGRELSMQFGDVYSLISKGSNGTDKRRHEAMKFLSGQ
jgi:hypothetical protein